MPTNRTKQPVLESGSKKGSKEFNPEADHLTVEICHAARLLQDHFEKLGYDEWILLGVCSRKLLEKVQARQPVNLDPRQFMVTDPNPFRTIQVGPTPSQGSIDTDAFLESRRREAVERRAWMLREAQARGAVGEPLNAEEELRFQQTVEMVTNQDMAERMQAAIATGTTYPPADNYSTSQDAERPVIQREQDTPF